MLGQVLELRARSRTGAVTKALLGLTPKTARRVSISGEEEDVPIEEIQPGDRLRIRPGEKVPVEKQANDQVVGTTRRERLPCLRKQLCASIDFDSVSTSDPHIVALSRAARPSRLPAATRAAIPEDHPFIELLRH